MEPMEPHLNPPLTGVRPHSMNSAQGIYMAVTHRPVYSFWVMAKVCYYVLTHSTFLSVSEKYLCNVYLSDRIH